MTILHILGPGDKGLEYGLKRIPPWHPHQPRHNAATELRKEFGIEAARIILGHHSPAITEVLRRKKRAAGRCGDHENWLTMRTDGCSVTSIALEVPDGPRQLFRFWTVVCRKRTCAPMLDWARSISSSTAPRQRDTQIRSSGDHKTDGRSQSRSHLFRVMRGNGTTAREPCLETGHPT